MTLLQPTLQRTSRFARILRPSLSHTRPRRRIRITLQGSYGGSRTVTCRSWHASLHDGRAQHTPAGWNRSQILKLRSVGHTRAQSTTSSVAADPNTDALSESNTGSILGYQSNEAQDVEQTSINNDEHKSESVILTEQPPLDIKQVRSLMYSMPITVADILHPRELNQTFKSFLAGHSRIMQCMTCSSTDELLPALARDLNLWLWKADQDNPSKRSSYLVKKEGEQYSNVALDTRDRVAPFAARAWDDLEDAIKARDLHTINRFRSFHWKSLMHICNDDTEALPSLIVNFRDSKAEVTANNIQVDRATDGFAICNDRYDIHVTAKPAKPGCVGQKEQFLEALVHYCQELRHKADLKTPYGLHFRDKVWAPAEFLQRAVSLLEYGDITFFTTPVSRLLGLSGLDIWHSEIRFQKQPDFRPSAVWLDRKPARTLATMHACAQLKPRLEEAYKTGVLLPQEYQIFARYWDKQLSSSNTSIAAPLSQEREVTIALPLEDNIISQMLDTLRELRDVGFSQLDQDWSVGGALERTELWTRKERKRAWLDARLKSRRDGRTKYLPFQTSSEVLPVLNEHVASNILNTIKENDLTIITAATGSGKTTQIPQMIFDEYINADNGSMCYIACTQPRRVSTISVAKRVASERLLPLGDEVGYNVRFDNETPKHRCGINYMTNGLLLRILESSPQWLLTTFSHIVLDEVHARDVDADLLLTALKNLMTHPLKEGLVMPKIVLMSATIDAEYFAEYFKDIGVPIKVSTLNVPGKSYHVEVQRLQDLLPLLEEQQPHEMKQIMQNKTVNGYIHCQLQAPLEAQSMLQVECSGTETEPGLPDAEVLDDLYVPTRLIPLVIDHIMSVSDSGDILIFLPGLSEIEDVEDLITTNTSLARDFTNSNLYRIFKLHSALYETNFDVFNPVPSGCRRIVLATNIAETSLTLPDVKFVIDTGLSRQNFYEQSSQSGQLRLVWISKAEVTQRRGRVGRTQPGHYFALYSDGQYNMMDERPQPELTRTSLTQIVLRVQESSAFVTNTTPKSLPQDANVTHPGVILLAAPSAPDQSTIIAAGQELRNLRAVTNDGQVTALGKVLSQIPTGPAAAKAILLGSVFRCLDPLIFSGAQLEDCPIMANATSTGSVTTLRKQLAASSDDDKLADAKAFFAYDNARRTSDATKIEDMKTNLFLRHDTYREISQSSRQIYGTIKSLLGPAIQKEQPLTEKDVLPPYLFPHTPPLLNVNSDNNDLVKALALSTVGSRLALWQRRDWSTASHPRVLPSPRSVNHASARKGVRDQRLKRASGDLLAYGVLRILPKDKYPWACETSCVSALTGILFAESLRLIDDDILVINDWARYRIKPATGDSKRAAKIVLEYRKALDRFLAMALQMIALHPNGLTKVKTGEMQASDFNVFLREEDHPYRKIFVDSVIKILDLDSKARAEAAEMRRLDAERIEAPPTPTDEEDTASLSTMPDQLVGTSIEYELFKL